MPERPLGPSQRLVLDVLATLPPGESLTGRELIDSVVDRKQSIVAGVQAACRGGLVQRVDPASAYGTTRWAITPAGRAALADSEKPDA